MTGEVNPVPEQYGSVTPSLTIRDCAEAIEFYERALGAEEISRAEGPGGSVWHAEIRVGDSIVMVNDEYPDQGSVSPEALGGSPVSLWVYVEDVDAAFERAVEAGAEATMEPDDMFWGDRMCAIVDPYGHEWSLASRVEDLSREEMERRQAEALEEWEGS